MNFYIQKDKRWGENRLGTCNTTISTSGCFVTSLAMLDGRTPDIINSLLLTQGGYADGCDVISAKAAQILGLEYLGNTIYKPGFTCIAETNFYANKGYPQHFFVLFPDGHINCPLLGPNISNPYNIVSYRLFKEKVDTTNQPAQNTTMDPCADLRKQCDDANAIIIKQDGIIKSKDVSLKESADTLADCQDKLTKTEQALAKANSDLATCLSKPGTPTISVIEPTPEQPKKTLWEQIKDLFRKGDK